MNSVSNSKEYRHWFWGWLSYAFASEVFAVVSLTLFLPICLEQFARDNGFLLPGRTEPCVGSSTNFNFNATIPDGSEPRCVVKLGWVWVDSASYTLYVYSTSVAIQALTVISMGGLADHPPLRKVLLLSFALLGSIAATLFLALPSSSALWPLSALFAIFANVGFGASIVAMNAYLPSLAQGSPEVAEVKAKLAEGMASPPQPGDEHYGHIHGHENEPLALADDDQALLLPRSPSDRTVALAEEYSLQLSRATSRISSLGIASGYTAGIVLLLATLVPVTLLHGTTFSLRLAIGMSGIWWMLFSIPAAIWLPRKHIVLASAGDGEEEPVVVPTSLLREHWTVRGEVAAAWRRLGRMLRPSEIRKLRNTFWYLAAWFLLSDGFSTITSTAILFGKTTLNMQPQALILIGVITPTAGILGSLVWPVLQRRFKWTNLRVLTTLVILASLIPVYGCLGFLPFFHEGGKVPFGGLTTQGEMFVLAFYFGSVYGAFQSYARAFYAELIPPGEEARWYALFSITDKSSSFIGPLIVGLIADLTGNIRFSFFFLTAMVWAAIPFLLKVDIQKGASDAQAYAHRREGHS